MIPARIYGYLSSATRAMNDNSVKRRYTAARTTLDREQTMNLRPVDEILEFCTPKKEVAY